MTGACDPRPAVPDPTDAMDPVPTADYWRPSPFEVATSWMHGRVAPPDAVRGPRETPRAALEAALLQALRRAPCYVAFSGGRDSSALLAVAVHVARTHGLPAPVPVTELYPGVPESDESEWQELVMSHLGLQEWVRLEFPDGNDLLGTGACESLLARGVIWPVALHVKSAVLGRLGGSGAFVTGEGGDEVLGRRRGAQVSRLWRRRPVRTNGHDLRSAASALAPRPYRRSRVLARFEGDDMQPWLRHEARLRHHRLLAADAADEPLTTRRSLEWLLTRRATAVSSHNYGLLAADHGLELHEPLLDPRFVRSLAATAGTWGFSSRTEAMRALFDDLLPAPVLSRRTKAYFNRALVGEATRTFAEDWDGTGIDPQLVDSEVLRAEWLSDFPSAIATPLLHSAWLASVPTHSGGAR